MVIWEGGGQELGQEQIPPDIYVGSESGLHGIQRLARAMALLAESLGRQDSQAIANLGDRRRLTLVAKAVQRERLRRVDCFPQGLFGEPSWDILLDLFIAWQSGEERLVKEACIASQVPEATALRYIDLLIKAGLVDRRQDPNDQRRKFVRLTGDGRARMKAYFEAMPFIGGDQELLRALGLGAPAGSTSEEPGGQLSRGSRNTT